MKKETKDKLITSYWIIIYSLAVIGVIGILRYLVYGRFY
jgi:hypothetical protein